MMRFRLKHVGISLLAFVVVATVACREEPPTERHNRNLGTSDRLLLPTAEPQFDAAALSGRETIVPLQNVSAAKATETAAADDKAAIISTIEKFQAAFRASDYDTIVPMLVERQREKATATADLEKEMSELVGQILKAMEETLPALYQTVGVQLSSMLNVEFDLNQLVVDGDIATIPMPMPGAQPFQLEKVDGEWFLAMPDSPGDIDAAIQQSTAQKQAFQVVLDALQDDSLDKQQRTQRVLAAFGGMSAAGSAPPSSDAAPPDQD